MADGTLVLVGPTLGHTNTGIIIDAIDGHVIQLFEWIA